MRILFTIFKKYKALSILNILLFFSSYLAAQSISTDSIVGSPFCACTSIKVSFTSTGLFNPGNIFTAQLSDATGNFASPVIIGALI
ncbi:MAG: hypothetical protein H0W84_13130, partial [Bacteroidetes bacterium]|nr:hypothetical protein [Bacteroidota bacterium]